MTLACLAALLALVAFIGVGRSGAPGPGPVDGGGVGRAQSGAGRGGHLNVALTLIMVGGGAAIAGARPARTRLDHRRQVLEFRATLEGLAPTDR